MSPPPPQTPKSKHSSFPADGRGHPNTLISWWPPPTPPPKPRSLETDVWTQYVIIIIYFQFSFLVWFVHLIIQGCGTWGWRISLLKVWQLTITLFNASFESLISNCLQEPIHGTQWKRHTKRVDLLPFPSFQHLCLIITHTRTHTLARSLTRSHTCESKESSI